MRAGAIAAIVAVVTLAAIEPVEANKKPWLGVMVADNCPVSVQGIRRPGCHAGVRIDDVIDNTPAERAKLTPGDVIVKVSGAPVAQANKLIDEITNNHKVGDVAVLDVIRRGQAIKVRVTLDARLSMSEMFAQAHVGTKARDVWRPLVPVGAKQVSSRVSSHAGDVVVVYLFATGCKPCAKITRVLESVDAALGRRGLVVLAASEESPAALAKLKTRLSLFSDTGNMMRRTFSIRRGSLPIVAVVGRDGVITHAALGDGVDGVELKAAIERAVNVTTARFH